MTQSTIEHTIVQAGEQIEGKPIRVLHVDDETGFLKVANQILNNTSTFEVDTASSVEEAMNKIKTREYDAILSDYQMPNKDGLQFLKELRQSDNQIPFIIFTGKSREEIAIKALNLGADYYLNKTGSPETVYGEVRNTIRKAVRTKRAEKLHKESEEKYKILFQNAKDVTVIFDLKGNITSINKAADEYGLKTETTIGKNMLDFVSKKTWPRLLKELILITSGKTVEGKLEIKTPMGRKATEYRSTPIIISGKIIGFQTVLRDTTRNKNTEEELKKTQRNFQELFNSVIDPIVITNRKGRILEISESLVKIGGFSRKELIGRNFLRVKGLTKKSKALLLKNLSKRMLGMEVSPYEVELITRDGRKIPAEVNATRIKYMGKSAVMAIFRDITLRKKAEESMKNSLDKLRVLNEKLEVVGSLTRHDVQNKLSTISGRIFLASQKLIRNSEAKGDLVEAQRALGETERILNFSRDYESLGKEELTYVSVRNNLRRAVSLLPESGAELEGFKIIDQCPNLCVLADSVLQQLFYNFIDNSIKHGEHASQIRIKCETGKNDLRLIYEDNGVGILKAEKEKIFEKGHGGGTGLGLYLIKKICEVYGWSIKEMGKPGEGAQFTMIIPKLNEEGKANYKLN